MRRRGGAGDATECLRWVCGRPIGASSESTYARARHTVDRYPVIPRQECEHETSNKTADEAIRHQDTRAGPRKRHQRAPEPLQVHPGALRRVLALAEGRRPVHRRPSRRGRVPDRRGARAPREHLSSTRSCASRRRSASRASPSCRPPRARNTAACTRRPPRSGHGASSTPLFSLDQNEFESALAADHVNVEDTARKVSRSSVEAVIDAIVERREGARRRNRPDGVLRQLPAAPADAARSARRGRRQPLAGGARPARPDRRRARS